MSELQTSGGEPAGHATGTTAVSAEEAEFNRLWNAYLTERSRECAGQANRSLETATLLREFCMASGRDLNKLDEMFNYTDMMIAASMWAG